ncbi:MAG: endonuclease [Bacteroides sp.]|nr:endonuclease [Bacteroides sp.]
MVAAIQGFAADRNIPQGYYNKIDGKSEAELKTAVYQTINPHTEISGYYNLPQYFQVTDVYPESTRWWDMYSDIPLYAPKFTGLNREHSFPKSWWGGSTEIPAYTDLNHLYPSEAAANMAKYNYPLGEVDMTKTVNFNNGITTVGYPVSGQGGGASLVFEPDDEYKGDFARTYMYVATCYQNLRWKYTYMVDNNTYPTLNRWSQELLLKWAREDEVSQKEIDRNEAVYAFQNNRNPFIDFPDLMEYIWGNHKGEKFVLSEHLAGDVSGEPILINPTQGSVLEFGDVAEGHSIKAKLHINGDNLIAGDLRLQIYDRTDTDDNGAEHFFIDGEKSTKIGTAAVNDPEGVWVTVEYSPKSIGEHTSRLLITGGGITGSVGVGLRGACFAAPTLTAPTATAATDINATSYTANWIPVEGEVVDYWVVNRTKYENGTASTEQLLAEEPHLSIDDFCGNESYTVQSVRLGVYSPQSNSISVSTAGITTVEQDAKIAFNKYPGGILVVSTEAIEHLTVFAPSGREILHLTNVQNNEIVELQPGVYVISANKSTPVKVIITNE